MDFDSELELAGCAQIELGLNCRKLSSLAVGTLVFFDETYRVLGVVLPPISGPYLMPSVMLCSSSLPRCLHQFIRLFSLSVLAQVNAVGITIVH